MVNQIVLVSLGGFFGAIARYYLNKYYSRFRLFPLGTFLVNTTGSFLMGILMGCDGVSSAQRHLIGSGFLGAYTTFSTFTFELSMLKRNHRDFQFCLYFVSSYFVGIGLAFFGYSLTKYIFN
jgi:fluoride exporter